MSSDQEPQPAFAPLSTKDLQRFKHSSWHSQFRSHTPKTSILPLTPQFIEWLEEDGIVLPLGSESAIEKAEEYEEELQEDEEPSWSFPELDRRIRAVLDKYDGAVFPKFDFSAPQDASWMLANPSLKCLTPADVYLLLKSSDFVTHDLTLSEGERVEHELVLKKWFDMPRSSEWRAFVKGKRLIAISQRDLTFYDFHQEAGYQSTVKSMVQQFFNSVVLPSFPLESFTFDVYLTRSMDRVFLLDFNPWAEHTDTLLFTWSELFGMSDLALRVVDDPMASQGTMPRFSHNAYPAEMVSMSQGVGGEELQQRWTESMVDAVARDMAESDLDGGDEQRPRG